MKKILTLFIGILFVNSVNAQIKAEKLNAGSIVTKLGFNLNSSLTRDWIILNDFKCPVTINGMGINVLYYRFKAEGNINTNEPITAYEIHHVLYDVFGSHIKTLSNLEIIDINGNLSLNKNRYWDATKNQVTEYLYCVSYVAKVRTQKGTIWRYNPIEIQSELNKIGIKYDEGFAPKNIKEEK